MDLCVEEPPQKFHFLPFELQIAAAPGRTKTCPDRAFAARRYRIRTALPPSQAASVGASSTIFARAAYHPDCTVGTGISPVRPRHAFSQQVRFADYHRRFGISPTPEHD